MSLRIGNVPTSTLNDTDNIIFTEGEAPRKQTYLSMKQDILGTETMTTTATSIKGAVNELDNDISGINTQLSNKANKTSILQSVGYNVRDYGATGDGSTDDLTAFDNVIADVTALGGGVIIIPPGKYYLSGALTIANIDIVIQGAGIQQTQLFFPSSNGIVYTTTNYFTDQVQISDLSIVTLSNNLYTAISISFPSNVGSSWVNSIIERVCISGTTTISDYNVQSNVSQTGSSNWLTGIYLNNSAVSHIRDCAVRCGTYVASASGTGIWINGYTVDILIEGCKVYNADNGIKKTGLGEGLTIDNCVLIQVGKGILINPDVSTQNGVYASISSCHISYWLYGMIVAYQPQITVENCLIYHCGADSSGADLYMNSCSYSHVRNNTCAVNVSTGVPDGIVIASSPYTQISNNTISSKKMGIYLDANSNCCLVTDNICTNNTTNYTDSGTGNLIKKNVHIVSTILTLTNGQTSVSIAIPTGKFSSIPVVGTLTSSSSATQYITGFYVYDSSSATSAVFTLKRTDNASITAEAIRFSLALYE